MSSAANTGRPRSRASQLTSSVRYVFTAGGPGPGGWTIATPQAPSSPGSSSFVFPACDDTGSGLGRQQIETTIERIISLYQGAGNALIDLASMFARRLMTGITSTVSSTLSGVSGVSGQPAPSVPPPGTLACEVISKRRVEVTLDFYMPAPRGFAPVVHALYAGDGQSKALTDIAFVAGGTQRMSALRIVVPDDQPPGVYTGAVVDMMTGEPGGHLILRLF
jgi:hypothetical protein